MDYSAFENFVFRTPLRPFQTINLAFGNNTIEDTSKAVIDFFNNSVNQEALFIASPDLYYSFIDYQKGIIRDDEQGASIIGSLLKYMVRMTTRATPFGLFAGCSTGEFGKETNLIIDDSLRDAKHTRLDMNYVCALAKEISQKKTIRKSLKFYPNTTLYEVGLTLRYIERKYYDTQVSYHISQVEKDDFLNSIIKSAKSGSSISSLLLLLVNDEITHSEAEVFINDLIDNQLLVDELEPSVCGDEFYDSLINTLQRLDKSIVFELNQKTWLLKDFTDQLLRVKHLLQDIDKNEENRVGNYEMIVEILKEFGVKFELNRLFQTDLIKKAAQSTISTEILSDAKQCLKAINKLNIKPTKSRLDEFARAFQDRYEDQEMPLMQVLDTEYGIGYTSILDGQSPSSLNRVEALLLKKLTKALQEQNNEIKIEDIDLVDFTEYWSDKPDTLACMVQLLKKEDNYVLNISGGGGPGAANMLGRFCHADTKIEDIVKSIIKKENELKADEVIYAEINHITEARTGNILSRPIMRDYEIPFLAQSHLGDESQINLSDLMLSVKQNKIVLRSRKLNKVILPRLTNAHNYNYGSTQPIYQFLGDYQTFYDASGVYFSWGKLENMFDCLPRVTFKGHILSKAKWAFLKKNIEDILKVGLKKQLEAVDIWRKRHKMPDRVLLTDGDNELLIDFKNPLSVSNFITTIKNRDRFLLEEFLFDNFSTPVSDNNSSQYINQVLLLFHRNRPDSQKNLTFKHLINEKISDKLIKREFLPGDEWVYFKLYCGIKDANNVLVDLMIPFINKMKEKGLIDKWFFLRYTDPNFHLRIRFKAKELSFVGIIISEFYQKAAIFHQSQQIRKIAIDTYSREIERYGSNSIELVEDIFYHNSSFVLHLITIVDDFSLNWLSCIRYIDRFLSILKIGIFEKKEIFERLSEGFGREFNKNNSLKKQLGNQFREQREQIKEIIDNDYFEKDDFSIIAEIIKNSLDVTKTTTDRILALNQQLEVPIKELLASIIHMFLNRVFEEKQRYNEMVLYHMMWHHYRSELARLETKRHEISSLPTT